MDPVKNEVKTDNLKTEETLRRISIIGGKNTYRRQPRVFLPKINKSSKTISSLKHRKKVTQALKKLDTSYIPDSINYINDKFKDIMIEDTSQ